MTTHPSGFMSDVAYGLRQIKRNPSLTALCVMVLAIGIGSATAVFAVLYGVLLKPLPYREANRLVYVHNEFPSSQLGHTFASAPDYADLTAHREIFSETAAYYYNDFTMSSASASEYAQHVDVVNASASLFFMLGTPPQLGRAFLPEEDRFGAPKVVLLSDSFWKSKFGADPKILGRTIQLDAVPYQVVGVMPADFNSPPFSATQMWIPLALRPEAYTADRGGKYLNMLGRLAPGVTLETANAMLATVGHRLAAQHPDEYPEATGWHFSIEPMLAERTKDVRKWLLLAFGAVVCVLLIACTNVSGLLLVRASVRRRELAVRSALGASSGRLVRQILTETALFVVMGCVAGVGLAITLLHLINTYGPLHHAQIEPWTLAFALALCVISTFLAGLLPAMLSSRVSLEQALRAGAGRASTGQTHWRGVLVAGQIAIAVALLFTATALGRSFAKLLEVSPGFSVDRVWTASVQLPERSYSASASHASFFRNLVDRIAALPGVESASAGISLPFSSGGYTADLYFPGRPEPTVRPAARVDQVLPDYFETLKIPLLKGRTLTSQDRQGSPPVVVIDEEFARVYFPGEDPIGKLIANNCCHDQPSAVVGIVANVATRDLGAPRRPQIYWPQLQEPNSAMFLVVRQAGQTDVTSAVREILHQQDPSVALFDVESLPARILDSVKLRRFVAWLLNSFALVGLTLAALGLYGTLAYLVQLRRREIAIRMALGATPPDVARLVAQYSLSLALAGLIPGVLLCAFAERLTQSFLFHVTPFDLSILMPTALGLLVLVAIATWSPVAQAAAVNTLTTLHDE
ncbi:MAG TPA: ABC transporter permease [Candidatus Acidoferrum sp.]|nr:ABC transporter permease [Candidatus Acidoferrum sp.]